MPMPNRGGGEPVDNFLTRCMSDPTMVKEYPPDQRYAICLRLATKSGGNSNNK